MQPELLLLESGGDNLAANFSRELSDYTIYVVDVAGGVCEGVRVSVHTFIFTRFNFFSAYGFSFVFDKTHAQHSV